jgi:hypothetical protein
MLSRPAVRGKQTRLPTIEELTQLLDAADDDLPRVPLRRDDDPSQARRVGGSAVA